VNNVSFTCGAGEFIGIIGRSGAGKSTLLRLINRLEEPCDGEISYKGQAIRELKGRTLRSWRRSCAMIFQQFNLSPRLDVITNVLVGALAERPMASSLIKFFPEKDRARAIIELDKLDMAHAALQRTGTLSGGQQQRVAIARAMLQEPSVILADEPVASLDPVNSQVVMEALSTICRERGIPVLINLHSLELARRYCTRVVAMAKGSVIMDGAPTELTPSMIDAIYGSRDISNGQPNEVVMSLRAA